MNQTLNQLQVFKTRSNTKYNKDHPINKKWSFMWLKGKKHSPVSKSILAY